MTRVMLITDAVGGVWTYSLELARALAPHAVEVVLGTLGPAPSPDQRAELAASHIKHSFEIESFLEWMEDPWGSVDEAGIRLIEWEARVRPDVIHLNGYAHAALPWSAPALVVGHSDVLSWWRAVHGEPAPPPWEEYARRVREGLEAAAMVIAPTRAMLDSLEAEYGISGGMVVPNGRSHDWVPSSPKEPLILCAGRLWDPAKNVEALATVADRLEWPVYLAGDGSPSAEGPERFANSLGMLSFHELAAWLGRASIFVSPARYEPFGLAALEAGLCRCALVLGDIPSLREVWGDAAVYVAPDDRDGLANALRDLIREPERRGQLGNLAFSRALQYDPARMANSYLAIYRSLLPGRGGGPG